MNDSCIFTIVAKNYISYARVLIKSFLKFHPKVKVFVLLADKIDGYFDPSKEVFETIEADNLGIEDFDSFSFKYNIVEFNTAVKPFFIEYLFSKFGFKKIIYLDPDILIFRPLTEIFRLLDKYSIILTPHIMKPFPDDNKVPADIHIIKAGCYNLGFIALAKSKNTDKLLAWWKQKLYNECLTGSILGYAFDQIWISLVPCFFDDYFVIRKPGYNVCYWNLHERNITKKGNEFLINNHLLYFFHFSGFDINNLNQVSNFQNRFKLTDVPLLRELFEIYKGLLIENDYHKLSNWPYYYGFFENGSKIPDLIRSIYWGLGTNSKDFGNPYSGFYRQLFRPNNWKKFFRKHFLIAIINYSASFFKKLIRLHK